jgi:hypothetical protein
MKHLN